MKKFEIIKKDFSEFHKLDSIIYNGVLKIFMKKVKEYNGCKNMAEFGINKGEGAASFLSVNPNCNYFGYDDWTDLDAPGEKFAREILKKFPNVTIFKQKTNTVKELPTKMDLIYVDGDHSKQGCLDDLKFAKNNITEKGVIIVHDYFFHCVLAATSEWYEKEKENFNRQFNNLHRGWVLFWRKNDKR